MYIGFRTASTDADRGSWSYVYTSLGDMTQQTDANGSVMTFVHDGLSRLTQRVEPVPNQGGATLTRTWVWGTAADNTASNKYIGRLKSQTLTSSHPSLSTDYSETFTYDQYARPIQTRYRDHAASADYYVDREYQGGTGYLNSLTYPHSNGQRLRLQYEYQNGDLKRVKDYDAWWITYCEAVANNARGQNRPVSNCEASAKWVKVTGFLMNLRPPVTSVPGQKSTHTRVRIYEASSLPVIPADYIPRGSPARGATSPTRSPRCGTN